MPHDLQIGGLDQLRALLFQHASELDYVALDETVKPKFIYYVVGHGTHGKKEAVFDEVAVERIKPQLDEYCKINLSKSAYKQVMASSMASDPVHGAGMHKAK